MKRDLLLFSAVIFVSGLTALAVVKLADTHSKSYSSSLSDLPIHRVSFNDSYYPDFTFAAENAVKAVVHVKVVQQGSEEVYSLFDFFFGNNTPQIKPRIQKSSGSGVIISSDGYIVTNNHVIAEADDISVTLGNNKSFKARIIGADPATDIALIKIDCNNLPYLIFGNSDSLRLGEWVLAIGNPYNLTSTVTAGIVSAKARSIPSENEGFKIESFIQTDAAVNAGNSGGALINTKGELVGINTAIASRTGDYTGYSFAVPSSIAEKVVNDIIDFGSVKRAIIGISMREIDDELSKEIKIKDIKGVYIEDVAKYGAAYNAGIKSSDILFSINGINVNSLPAVQEQINKYRPGQKIEIGIIRGGKQKMFSVVLGSREANLAKPR